jgi:hypothetical protein
MSGTMTNILGVANTNIITVHGSFNGSVAGIFALGQPFGYQFYVSSSSQTFITNTPTAIFSDVDSSTTLYPLSSSSYWEKDVAVQPFVYAKSASPSVSAINNVNFGQLQQLLLNGTAPLSQFTGTNSDSSTTVYLVQRTSDSGTRVTAYLEAQSFAAPNNIYYYDTTGVGGYYIATTNMYTDPLFIAGNFGPGYVSGGNIATVLGKTFANNTAIGYLSFSDAKGVTAVNWGNLCSYNGQYPVLNYVPGSTPLTNDFAPVRNGQYSFWAYEITAWPKQAQYGTYTDQQMPYASASAILNKLSGYNGTTSTKGVLVGGVGSIDNEVVNQNPPTAISIFTMHCSRPSVGGPIGTF